jgi:C4-dicarboxylate-specific signal transduction histidine kinase
VPLRRLISTHPIALSLGLVAVVFGVDLCLPLGVASAVPYTFAVLLALRAKPGWFGPAIAALCGVLTITKMVILPDRGTTELWKVIVNRGLALFAVGMTTLLGVLRRRSEAERVAVEEKLREHQANLAHLGRLTTLGQLATNLAHELNQPLTAIHLQADVALKVSEAEARTPSAVRPALVEIANQARRAAEVVKAVRRMAQRTTAGHEAIDLPDVVRVVYRLIEWQANRAGVVVHTPASAAPLPPVRGDHVQIEQVLFNLVQNAIEAANESGDRAVWIETGADGSDAVAIRVRDSGPGVIEPDRVFDQFYTTKPNGLGVGLAISRSIVEAHGGRLWVDSPAGRGAVFAFSLPVYRKEDA